MKITLLILTLNEIGGMKAIMPKIKKEWVDQILIVDGGSNDGTVKYAEENGYFVLSQKKRGLRQAYIEALPYITGDIVITFSPDGNCIPEFIPVLIEKMKEDYDMVIASRYLKEAKSYDDDMITFFGNRMFTLLINLLFGAKYTDALVILRAWKKKVIYDLKIDERIKFPFLENTLGSYDSWEPLLSILCAKRQLRCTEIPGSEPKRMSEKRKMRPLYNGSAVLFQIILELFFR